MKKSLIRSTLVCLAIATMLVGGSLLAGCGGNSSDDSGKSASTETKGGGTLRLAGDSQL